MPAKIRGFFYISCTKTSSVNLENLFYLEMEFLRRPQQHIAVVPAIFSFFRDSTAGAPHQFLIFTVYTILTRPCFPTPP